jgi:uncharacterized protein YggU (UPF0235/DUF167 family)
MHESVIVKCAEVVGDEDSVVVRVQPRLRSEDIVGRVGDEDRMVARVEGAVLRDSAQRFMLL